MKAVQFYKYGSAEELKLEEVADPVPGKGEVLVRVKACALNPVDYKIREGALKEMFPVQFPKILGGDVAGTIEGVGAGIREFAVGDDVFFSAPLEKNGGYAEKIVIEEKYLAKKPDKLSFEQAASLPVVGLTAVQALRDFSSLKEGQSVLIHAGAGGLGSFAIQYAKYLGARVLTTSRSENHSWLQSLGADVTIDYRTENFVEICKKEGGVDVIFETLGGLSYPDSLQAVKEGGRVPCVVNPPDYDSQIIAKNRNITTDFLLLNANRADLDLISTLAVAGHCKPQVTRLTTLDKIREEHHLLESGRTKGKIVLKVS